jgi:hypothetical protein
MPPAAATSAEKAKEPSVAAQLAIELQKNRELTRVLYTLRGEAPPNDHGCAQKTCRARAHSHVPAA